MKAFITDFVALVFLFAFVIFIAIVSSAKFWPTIISFGCIYILWQLVKKVFIWSDPSIEDEI